MLNGDRSALLDREHFPTPVDDLETYIRDAAPVENVLAQNCGTGISTGSPSGMGGVGMPPGTVWLETLSVKGVGIGFLIAAKSVFRFGELTSPDRRKQAEYIIIGTLFSVLVGSIGAYLTSIALNTFVP